jgi:alpha-beta hydrolase superfamily lysophospholipase
MKLAALVAAALVLATATAGAAGRQVTFPSGDGTSLAATFYEPSTNPAPGVVLVHMLGRSRDDWNAVADRMEEAGMMVVSLDLRGHGRSGGSSATLAPMVDDVRAAIAWLSARSGVRPGAVAVVGASLGANLAMLAGSNDPGVRAIALLSPSLDYRGVRIDAATIKKASDKPLWLAASIKDPYALRTIRDLVSSGGAREQRLSETLAHGTNLLSADPDIATALVDWLRRALY